jgi:SAM-dependent methyltransferase
MSEYIGKDLESMSFAKNYSKWLVEFCKPYLGTTVAEVGAGTGNLTELFSRHPDIEKLIAFEPSEKMSDILQKKMALNKCVKAVNNTLIDEKESYVNYFDSILYINVLEHIDDDRNEATTIHECLKSKGYVCIFVPALSFLFSEFDKSIGHYRRYHKQQLIDLFQSQGFNIIKVKYVDMPGIIPWYIAFVLLKKELNMNNTSIYDKIAIPVIRIVENFFTPPIGRNLLLIAQKP